MEFNFKPFGFDLWDRLAKADMAAWRKSTMYEMHGHQPGGADPEAFYSYGGSVSGKTSASQEWFREMMFGKWEEERPAVKVEGSLNIKKPINTSVFEEAEVVL